MFDDVKPMGKGEVALTPEEQAELDRMSRVDKINLDELTLSELMVLQDRVAMRLPSDDVGEMSLSRELVTQYQRIRALQTEAMNDKHEQLQKKASVSNSCLSALNALVRMQTELHTAERFKQVEQLMVKYIKMLPKHIADGFLTAYEQLNDPSQAIGGNRERETDAAAPH